MARPKATDQPDTARVFRGSQTVNHDLFKLLPSEMKKNVSWTPGQPRFEYFEHCHMFHTVDSSGRTQDTSTPIGGHFHEVKVIHGEGDSPPTIEVGPASHHVTKGSERVIVPLVYDTHTHDTKYLFSDSIKVREYNPDYLKVQSQIENSKPRAIPGIVG